MSEAFSFDPSWRWLDRPALHLETGLAGHAVAVLFWRVGCAHSRAALLELSLLMCERRQPSQGDALPLAVVAVHWPTCSAERDQDRLRRAVAELPCPVTVAMAPGLLGPGIVSPGAAGPANLPTMLLLDGQQVVRARAEGVPRRSRLQAAVEHLRQEVGQRSKRVESLPLPLVPIRIAAPGQLPSAVACDNDRIWIATSTPPRVLAFDHDGKLQSVVGSGQWGDEDGSPDVAAFACPHALALHDGHVVVADAHSHTLRAIDRETCEVSTWCGSGRLGSDSMGGSYGQDQSLSSPTGIVSRDGGLFVCHAGTDQLWQIDPMTGAAMSWLGGDGDGGVYGDVYGSAAEHGWHDDGLRQGEESGIGFREPLGIAASDDDLWVTEGRGRTLARVDMAHVERQVVDSDWARPTGVAVHQGRVFVCDSWRGEIVAVDVEQGTRERLLGPEHGLREPVSIAFDERRMFVVDRAAAVVWRVDMDREDLELVQWWPAAAVDPAAVDLAAVDLAAGESSEVSIDEARFDGPATAVLARACRLREHSDVELRIPLRLPLAGRAVDGPVAVDVADEAVPLLAQARRAVSASVADGVAKLLLPIADPGQGAFRIRVQVDGTILHYVLPVVVDAAGDLLVELQPA